MQRLLARYKAEGVVDKDCNPAIRDGRLVIPVQPMHKRQVRGIVHDESATGKTFFIEPEEIDSNHPIAAPVVGDIASSMEALLAGLTAYPMTQQNDWLEEIDRVKQVNAAKMEAKLNANPSPMDFFSALKAIRTVLEKHREVYLVNEGANTLDDTRNVINMYSPRKRLDCGTWGVMGVGMGYAIGAEVTSGQQVVCIEGDSAFGFSGMEIETICRYQLPVTIVILNNGGIYNGSHANLGGGTDPSPTT